MITGEVILLSVAMLIFSVALVYAIGEDREFL